MTSPDEFLQYVQPSHPRSVVQRCTAVVAASVGVGSGFQEDPDTVQVAVHDSDVQSCLAFHIH